jgi:branched-chain amino acid transport system substrate-binding protein
MPAAPAARPRWRRRGLDNKVFQITEGINNLDYAPMKETASAFMTRYPTRRSTIRACSIDGHGVRGDRGEAGSDDPVQFLPKLEGMKYARSISLMVKKASCAPDDHQFFQTMYISGLGSLGPDQPYDEEEYRLGLEGRGLGRRRRHDRADDLRNGTPVTGG